MNDGEKIDLLFVNAGIANGEGETLPQCSTEALTTIMVTNALSPLRVIAEMSSRAGSVADNTDGGWELYHASKASLNTLLRSFAIRRGGSRTVLAVCPGWVRTDMGGSHATLDVETSTRGIADMISTRRGRPGSFYVDYQNRDVAW
jgi:NAD(P)-dependent dehydrogenase (short-subunit alcohol dehydrogenase family)